MLLICLSNFPGILLLIYSIITRQHEEGLTVMVLAISSFIAVLFGGKFLSLKSIGSLIELSIGVDAARVLVVNLNRQALEFAASRGFRADALRNTRLGFGEGYTGQVILDQGTIYIPDLKARYMECLRSEPFDAEEFVRTGETN